MSTSCNTINPSKKVSPNLNPSFYESFFCSKETYIHPTAIVDPTVSLGKNVKIGPFCVVIGNVTINDGTRLHANISVGFPAQNLTTHKSLGSINIGKNCEIREFVSIGASKLIEGKTIIGDNCYIMSYSHVAHDVTLEENVTMINNVNLGGHVYVEKNAVLMANSAIHQFCRIGQFAALAPFGGARQDLPPFCMFDKIPAHFQGLNSIALKRAGIEQESINAIKHVAKLFYQKKLLLNDIKKLIEKESDQNWTQDKHVHQFVQFIENSKRGVSKKSIV